MASYLHWHGTGYFGRWRDGYSVSPVKKTLSRFDGGRGALTVWNNAAKNEGTFTRSWYLDGEPYLEKKVTRNRTLETALRTPNGDNFSIEPQAETLSLWSLHEEWTLRNGQELSAQIVFPYDPDASPDPVKTRIRQAWPLTVHGLHQVGADASDLSTQLAQDYLTRRQAFLDAYGRRLTAAGQTWNGLGLAYLLEESRSLRDSPSRFRFHFPSGKQRVYRSQSQSLGISAAKQRNIHG